MKHRLLALCLAAACCGGVQAAELYRYKDEKGVTVLNNVLPPEVVPRGYTVLSDKGQVLRVVPPTKTKAELAAERAANKKAKQEEEKLQARRRHDAMLLQSFTSIEDITRARDNQLGALDVGISVAESNISRVRNQLESQQARAADMERRGRAVPEEVNKDIADSLRQIKEGEDFIAEKRREQDRLRKNFEADMIRFQELRAANFLRMNKGDGETPNPALDGVFNCKNRELCDKAWSLAQLYAREKATTRLEIITNTIILTGDPKKDSDKSLSFSRIPDRHNREQILVEVRCSSSEAGQALCTTPDVSSLPAGFKAYVESRLGK
ncbi:MAG: DUF4124 domain-containing protein [Gammaproteobacteria bacterium]|nr:DUF4124 domain-containing protein [Gammaproteobacteria bacterium]